MPAMAGMATGIVEISPDLVIDPTPPEVDICAARGPRRVAAHPQRERRVRSGPTEEPGVRDQDCLYTIAFLPHERIEGLLLDEFAPIAREIEHHPDLDSLFFVRFSEPRWQLRFRVLGRAAWVRGPLREGIRARLAELERAGRVESHGFARYEPELERHGGELGMELAERLFHLDSMAAIEMCEAERRGLVEKPRREIALLLADALLDLAGFDPRQRIAFYRHGYAWALGEDGWSQADRELLEERFQRNRPALEALFDTPIGDERRWGGAQSAAIVRRFLAAARPVLERIVSAQAAGDIRQEIVYLLWSYAHMMTNRLGIESTAESILRFFMHRYLEERRTIAA
jgi:lantibiotic biosynthesis protein